MKIMNITMIAMGIMIMTMIMIIIMSAMDMITIMDISMRIFLCRLRCYMHYVKKLLFSWYNSKHWYCNICINYFFLWIKQGIVSDLMEWCPLRWSDYNLYILCNCHDINISYSKKLLSSNNVINSSLYFNKGVKTIIRRCLRSCGCSWSTYMVAQAR